MGKYVSQATEAERKFTSPVTEVEETPRKITDLQCEISEISEISPPAYFPVLAECEAAGVALRLDTSSSADVFFHASGTVPPALAQKLREHRHEIATELCRRALPKDGPIGDELAAVIRKVNCPGYRPADEGRWQCEHPGCPETGEVYGPVGLGSGKSELLCDQHDPWKEGVADSKRKDDVLVL